MQAAAYSADQIRAAEAPLLASQPEGTLMRRAARGLAQACGRMLREGRGRVRGAAVLVVVGPGNNGGDGLYAAATLAGLGARVSLWAPLDRHHVGGWEAALEAGARAVSADESLDALSGTDLVVDAFLGIDGRAGLPDDVAMLAAACDDLDVPVIAVDLPSGLVADAAVVEGATFRATRTVTFGAMNCAHLCQPARSRCGEVELVDLGLELSRPLLTAWTPAEVVAVLPVPDATSDKYSRGVVGLDTGSTEYVGAGVLGAYGAVYSGAGMVRFVGPKVGPVRLALPSVVAGEGRVQAWVLGSGWGDARATREHIQQRLADKVPTVLDADALRPDVLPPRLPAGCLLTPHAGELAALLDVDRADVVADPVTHVRIAARRHRATVLLKGSTQYVARRDGSVAVAVEGPAWTAQAGSGDVLAGICGTMLAAGLRPDHAALAAASLQAMAAARLDGPYPPQDVAREVAAVMGRLASLR